MQVGFYVGLDWGCERHALCVTDGSGKVVKRCFVQNDATALQVLADVLGDTPATQVHVGVETRRLAVVEALLARGFRVFTINPKQSNRFRERYTAAGAKDDHRDAWVLATTVRTDLSCFHAVVAESDAQVHLRAVTRSREVVAGSFRRASNRLREVILLAMPVLLGLCEGADEPWFWDLGVNALRSDLSNVLDDEAIAKVLKDNRIRKLKVADIREVLDRPHLQAANGLRKTAAWQAELLIAELRLLHAQEKLIAAEIGKALADLPKADDGLSDADIVMSMPGFGERVAALFLVEAHDALAERNLKQLRALAGVAPVTEASGKRQQSKDPRVVMRRAVSSRLRNAMFMAAFNSRNDPRFGSLYASAKARGLTHGCALRTVGNRQLTVLVAMLRHRTTYATPTNLEPSSAS